MQYDQIIIAITGGLSSWMIHDTRKKVRFYACLLALIGQPAWFYAAYVANQWGILAMDVIYTMAWIRGYIANSKE